MNDHFTYIEFLKFLLIVYLYMIIIKQGMKFQHKQNLHL